jgi:hypothetical protein
MPRSVIAAAANVRTRSFMRGPFRGWSSFAPSLQSDRSASVERASPGPNGPAVRLDPPGHGWVESPEFPIPRRPLGCCVDLLVTDPGGQSVGRARPSPTTRMVGSGIRSAYRPTVPSGYGSAGARGDPLGKSS